MIIETHSDLVSEIVRHREIGNTPVEIALMRNGKALAISRNAMAFYRDMEHMADPLGQSLIASTDIPETFLLPKERPWITSHKAGIIRLSNGYILLITPVSFRLYPCTEDALANRRLICELNHQG